MAIWVISGVAGSGKSSVAQAVAAALAWPLVEADDFHPEANRQKMASGQPLDETDREPWLTALGQALRSHAGADTVLAFPGLKASHRERIEKAVAPVPVHWARLELSQATVETRLARRGGFFPPGLAASQFKALEPDLGGRVRILNGERPLPELTAAALDWIRTTRK